MAYHGLRFGYGRFLGGAAVVTRLDAVVGKTNWSTRMGWVTGRSRIERETLTLISQAVLAHLAHHTEVTIFHSNSCSRGSRQSLRRTFLNEAPFVSWERQLSERSREWS